MSTGWYRRVAQTLILTGILVTMAVPAAASTGTVGDGPAEVAVTGPGPADLKICVTLEAPGGVSYTECVELSGDAESTVECTPVSCNDVD